MDNTKKTSHQKKPKSNLLLSCFGFSIQPVIEGNNPSTMVISITTSGTSKEEKKRTNKRNWFSLSSFRFKSSGVARTVPVDSSITSEKAIDGKKAPARKSKADRAKKGGDSDSGRNHSKRNKKIPSANPAANQELSRQITATPEVASAEGPPEDQNPVRQRSEQRIVLGNGKPLEHVDARSKNTWQSRQSFRRKVDALRYPGLPKIEPKLARAGPASTRSHENPASNPSRVVAAKNPPKENGEKVYDPMIGMSIIMVTLLIMLVWGRVCAILCTCAWFYFVPLLRNMVDQNKTTKRRESGPVEPDLDSKEHKKRVVLEGLLERSHHRSVG